MSRRDVSPAEVYLDNLAPGSRRTQESALERIAKIASGGRYHWRQLRWERLRYAEAQAIRAELARRYMASTATRMMSALRQVLRAAWSLGRYPHEEYERVRSLPPIRGERLPAGRHLLVDEIERLFAACGDDPVGVRDAAVFSVLFGTGTRVAEAAALDMEHADLERGRLTVRAGKRNKDRLIPLADWIGPRLEAWLAVRGVEPGALFRPLNGGRLCGGRLTPDGIRAALRRRASQAGLGRVTPHDLRRSCAGHLLDAGVDLALVQRILGHADPKTTSRYDRRGYEAAAAAMERLPRIGGGV